MTSKIENPIHQLSLARELVENTASAARGNRFMENNHRKGRRQLSHADSKRDAECTVSSAASKQNKNAVPTAIQR